MCGIAGYSGQFRPHSLERASFAIKHRGPDGKGLWFSDDGAIGLAHRRLAIIDLSPTGAQPMASTNGQVIVVFNGEIYNFIELRERLALEGRQFQGGSDTEVLLQLYLVYGEAMLPMLNGIFAFGIWDSRSAELFLARDALGVKPLYFTEGSQGFAFASEIKALLALMPEELKLNPEALRHYMTYLWCPGEGTPLEAVRKLGPGEALRVRHGKIVNRVAWYELPAFRGPAQELSERDAILGTRELLRQAVHRQMVSDVEVGAFLSGGLDSSAVVAFAREKVSGLRCFTIEAAGGEDEGNSEDLPYAQSVAKHLAVPLEVVQIDPQDMARDFEAMVFHLDEPLADPAPLNVLYISRLARQRGIKVLLSGAGGDDLFSGYRRHAALEHEWTWRWLPSSFQRSIRDAARKLDQRIPAFRRLSRLFEGAGLDESQRLISYFAWARRGDLDHLFTKRVREAIERAQVEDPMLAFLSRVPPGTSRLETMLALEQRFFLADHNLIYTDKMSMAAGVEVRVPFLDLELVEFASRVSRRAKQRGREGKWVLKAAMKPYLPAEIIGRPKAGFGAPVRRWMRRDLRPLLDTLLDRTSVSQRGLFDPDAVRSLIARNDAGTVDGAYTLFALLTVEVWCRRFLDGAPRVQLTKW